MRISDWSSDVCSSDLLSSCHHHFAKHPCIHVQHQMAVPCPASEHIGGHEKADTLRRLHRDGVAPGLKLAVRRFQFTPHAVQMHGVRHHGVDRKSTRLHSSH